MYNERMAIREYTKWIREERRFLAEEYWRAIERLRELDKNQPIQAEQPKQEQRLTKEEAQENIKHLKKFFGNFETNVPAKLIEEERDRAVRQAVIKVRKKADTRIIETIVVRFLKEAGKPVRTKDINDLLKEEGYDLANPTETMNRVMSYNPKIERVGRGYYQIIQ